MRVALVSPYAWDRPGGVQSHVRGLAGALRARGHEVCVFAPRTGATSAPGGVRLIGRALPVPANGSVAPVAFGPRTAAALRHGLDEFKPDVLHLHEPFAPSLPLLALARARTACVGTFHASGRRSYAYGLAAPVLRKLGERMPVRAAVSEAARSFAQSHVGGDYVLTPNGIDHDRFHSAQPLDLGPGPTVLFLSRIEARKGLDYLIQAVARLADSKVTLVVAGEGPRLAACRRLAERLAVPTRWLGRLSDDDLPRAYKGADVFCAPALGGESFGIVLAEAMAAGTPIVCSDLPGFRSVAKGAAELVPPGDATALAAALRDFLSDESRRTRAAKVGSKLATLFDWSRLVVGIEGLYERAVEERLARR